MNINVLVVFEATSDVKKLPLNLACPVVNVFSNKCKIALIMYYLRHDLGFPIATYYRDCLFLETIIYPSNPSCLLRLLSTHICPNHK